MFGRPPTTSATDRPVERFGAYGRYSTVAMRYRRTDEIGSFGTRVSQARCDFNVGFAADCQ